jgi:hypothetical protein
MSVVILERVKEFMVRLVKDRAFLTQIETSTVDERNKILFASGYNFSKKEFETAVIELIESKERGEFNELTEDEMVVFVGGYVGKKITPQPLYGVVRPPVQPEPVQPMYGVVTMPE